MTGHRVTVQCGYEPPREGVLFECDPALGGCGWSLFVPDGGGSDTAAAFEEAMDHHRFQRPLSVGDTLGDTADTAFCGGLFGRDDYGAKRVEAIGNGWVVARELNDDTRVLFAACDPEALVQYRDGAP